MSAEKRPTQLAGSTVLVTGGSSGIGLWTAAGLADLGADVVITSRSRQRGQEAADRIRELTPDGSLEVMTLDLADFTDVRRFADAFTERHEQLTVLVNNAGLTLSRRQETVDGHEMLVQSNHLGPFLLTNLLLPLLRRSAPARIVTVASVAHRFGGRLDLTDLDTERRRYVGLRAYGRTKLMNILFTRELGRRLEGSGVTATCTHPGTIRSGFGMDGDAHGLLRLGLVLARPVFKSPEQGARPSIHLASAPDLAGVTGQYYRGTRAAYPSRQARDDRLAQRLWDVSLELVGLS